MILSKSEEGTESCSFIGFVEKKVIEDQIKPWTKKPRMLGIGTLNTTLFLYLKLYVVTLIIFNKLKSLQRYLKNWLAFQSFETCDSNHISCAK